MSGKPVMTSRVQFEDYLAAHLGMVRCMKHLARKHEFFVRWDQVMGERWSSVINGRSPSPEQRRVALAERHNVNEILPLLLPVCRDLQVACHSLHAYLCGLPAPAAEAPGWNLRADLIHPDGVIKILNGAMDDTKCVCALDPESAYFKGLFDQLLEMARWTRTSLNPPAEDRAKVNFAAVTQADLEAQLTACVTRVCRSMHDFCELYAAVPTHHSMPAISLSGVTTVEGFEK